MNRRFWIIFLGVVAFFTVLGVGVVAGSAVTYFALQARPVQAATSFFSLSSIDQAGESGILLASVESNSPADEAGLVRGDILLEVNGETVDNIRELTAVLSDLEPGNEVALTVRHGDEIRSLAATLDQRDGRTYLGISSCGRVSIDMGPGERHFEWDFDVNPRPLPRFPGEIQGEIYSNARVIEVVPDSPAEEAGLLKNDIITSIDGEELESGEDLAEVIHSYQPGDTITLEIQREGDTELLEIKVTLGENPEEDGQAYLGVFYGPAFSTTETREGPFFFRQFQIPDFDCEECELDEFNWKEMIPFPNLPHHDDFNFEHQFDLPEDVTRVVIIGEVIPGSPADNAGLLPGDLITELDGEPVGDPESFAEAIREHEPGDTVSLTIFQKGEMSEPQTIDITLDENPDTGDTYLGVSITGYIHIEIHKDIEINPEPPPNPHQNEDRDAPQGGDA